MNCEYLSNCGFYIFLKKAGVNPEASCGKKNKNECPRYGQKSGKLVGEKLQQAKAIFRANDLYENPLPISSDEITIAFGEK